MYIYKIEKSDGPATDYVVQETHADGLIAIDRLKVLTDNLEGETKHDICLCRYLGTSPDDLYGIFDVNTRNFVI